MATKKKKKTANNGLALSDEWLIKERMRGLEKGLCYCSDNFDSGEGIVIVSHRHKGDKISFCAYIVDIFCLGLRGSLGIRDNTRQIHLPSRQLTPTRTHRGTQLELWHTA